MILVTGATGYIASRLIPRLLGRGHAVRALARTPERLSARTWSSRVEIVRGDVTDFASLAAAMRGVQTAYYLVHNMSSGHGYTKIELQAAENFARAAKEAGVRHIIYLGGLADPEQHIAPHMRSRIETGVTLRKGAVPVTEFRAGVVAGSGSISFEMIRFMTEALPVIPGPRWLRNKTQPIAVENVMDYLLAALDNWDGHGQVLEIGGPQVTTYQELMEGYACASGLARGFLLLPYVPVKFMAFGVGLVTPVPRPIARALIGGLSRDSIVLHNNAQDVYPIALIDFETAAKTALANLHPLRIERVWEGDLTGWNPFKHEGFFIDQRSARISLSLSQAVEKMRAFSLNGFTLESQTETGVLFRAKNTKYGKRWLEYAVAEYGDARRLTQTSYFAPHGLVGFVRAYGLSPFCRRAVVAACGYLQA